MFCNRWFLKNVPQFYCLHISRSLDIYYQWSNGKLSLICRVSSNVRMRWNIKCFHPYTEVCCDEFNESNNYLNQWWNAICVTIQYSSTLLLHNCKYGTKWVWSFTSRHSEELVQTSLIISNRVSYLSETRSCKEYNRL